MAERTVSSLEIASIFVANSQREATNVDRESLGRSLVATIAAARERWPGIVLDEGAFACDLAQRWTPETTSEVVDLPPFAIDLVLAHACLQGDDAAIRAFHREMFERVDRVLSRLGLGGADAADVKQDVRAKLLIGESGDAKLALYQGTGPLAHWVASVAGREALGARRRRRPTESLGDDDLLADAADDPRLLTLKARHSADFKVAFQAAVAELEPRDRAILRALIVDDRTVGEVAFVYGIHRVTASRWVAEIRHALLQGTRKRLREGLKLDEPSLESAIRMIDSNLDLSLYRLLADAA